MIKALHIRNMALIEEVDLEFGPGLNVLTGETGAGKTVIIGALGLLLGGRADADMVRTGTEAMEIEGLFDWTDAVEDKAAINDILSGEDEPELLIRRVLASEGRSRCAVNGRLATVSALADAAGSLVEIHGQHEHQRLLRSSTHGAYLDRYGGEEHLAKVLSYRELFRRWSAVRCDWEDLRQSEGERERQLDLLGFQVRELEAADEQEGEYDALLLERRRLQNAELLHAQVSEACALIAGDENLPGAADATAHASLLASKIAQLDPSLADEAAALEDAGLRLREAARAFATYRDGIHFDQQLLEEVESRLRLLGELRRKYGADYREIQDFLEKARERLALFENHRVHLDGLKREAAGLEAELRAVAKELSSRRRELAEGLSQAVDEELADLNMGGVSFRAAVEEAGALLKSGEDVVEFTVASAPGEPHRPMAKIASGGELSRIMLALKIVLAGADRVPVLVFDEVDSGIGGITSAVLGRKLARLSRYHQVFCVTHLAQIASYADRQFRVFKEPRNGTTVTGVRSLQGEERLDEISRMLGGDSLAAHEHARELMAQAQSEKDA